MILVTGHSGFVGKALIAELVKREIPHAGLSRATGHDLSLPIKMPELEQVDWIVHLAGKVGVEDSWEDPADHFTANYLMALQVLEYARATGAGVIFLSSYLYGTPQYLPVDEHHPIAPTNPYGHSKAHAENLILSYAELYSITVRIFRVFNLFGPGQPDSQLISRIISQALDGDTIAVRDLAPKRDYLWIDDLIEIILKATEDFAPGCEIYNVGSGKSYSVQDVIDCVTSVVGPRNIECENRERENEIPDCYSDSQKLRDRYIWQPMTDLKTGIERLVDSSRPSA